MATTRTTVTVGVLAFAAGAVIAGLVATAWVGASAPGDVDRGAPVSGGPPGSTADAGRPARAERPRQANRDATAVGSERLAALSDDGGGVTAEEAVFIRKALEAERTRRREGAIRPEDEGLAIVGRYLTHGADVSAVVASFDAMRAHIRTPDGPVRRIDSTGDRTQVDLTKDLADATVVEFGPGTFVLGRGAGSWNVRQYDTPALEIRGAGMDRTKLIGPGWAFLCVDGSARAQNLILRDLTIDGAELGQIILDARGGISAALERVRITGWEVAGHAAPLGVSGNAFLACRDCEFVGPGNGYVLSLRGPAIATFDRCRFTDASAAFIGPGGPDRAAVVAVRDCTFDNIRLADSRIRGDKRGGVTIEVRGGSAAAGASSWTDEKRREWWGAAYAAKVEGVSFTAARPLFPFAELLRAADLAVLAGMRDIVAIEAFPGARGTPVEIDVYLYDREKDAVVRRSRRLTAGGLEELEKEPRRGMRGRSIRSAAEIDGVLALPELLRRMQVADDESFTQVDLRPAGQAPDGTSRVWLMAQTPGGPAPVVIDARTGEVQQRR